MRTDKSKNWNMRRELKILSLKEIDGLKGACDTFTDQIIVYGLLYTGMRVNELCNMNAGWINLDDETITIPKEQGTFHPKIVKVVKGGKLKKIYCANRTIKILNPVLVNILERMIKYNYKLQLNRKQVWFRLNQLWEKTGAKDRISPHLLRHTCLTFMCRKSISIPSVAAQAGHHNTDVTTRLYVHPDDFYALKEIADKGGI